MASNNSSLTNYLTDAQLQALIPKFLLYTLQGALITLLNVPIFLCIWCFSVMRERNEYVLLSALAFTDTLNGVACFLAGTGRTWLIATERANQLRTSLQCLLTPWNLIWMPWEHTYGAMLAAISMDRFLLTTFPMAYLAWGTSYVWLLLAIFHLPYLPAMAYLVWNLWQSPLESNKPAICCTDWIYADSTYYHVNHSQSVGMAVASVVLYAVVVVRYRKRKAKVMPKLCQQGKKETLKRQHRLTITLGFSSACTFLFHVLPLIVKQVLMWMDRSNETANLVIPYVYMVQNLNPLCNFGFYVVRHADLRLAVKCLFSCRELTQSLVETNAKKKVKKVAPKTLK